MPEWEPPSARPVEDDKEWEPPSARIPVKAHSRAKRGRAGASIGGFVGGLVGKPLGLLGGPLGIKAGGIAGAGLGGSIGEAMQQGLEVVPPGPQGPVGAALQGLMAGGADLGQIGQAGAEQAAYEAGGGVLAKGVKLGGRFAMQAALRSTPEVAQVAIREGIQATKGGLNKLLFKLGQAGKATENLVVQATQRGAKYQPADIASSVYKDLLPTIQNQAIYGEDVKALGSLSQRFVRDHRGLMTPAKLHAIKQSADQAAKAIYQRIERGGQASGTDLLEARWHKATADKARNLLDAIPGYTESNLRTQELIGVKQAVFPEVKKGSAFIRRLAARTAPAAVGGTIGGFTGGREGAIAGAGAGLAASSPHALSLMALILSNPALAKLLMQAPRGVGAAISE